MGEDGRPWIKWTSKNTGKGSKEKTKKAEEKIEENKVLYMADGEGKNGRPHIKWRRKLTTNTAGEGGETVDNMKEAETGIETQKQNC